MICKTCLKDKNNTDFYVKHKTTNRLSSECKDCFNLKSRTQRGHIGLWKSCKKCNEKYEPKQANSQYCEKCKDVECPICKKHFTPSIGVGQLFCSKECSYVFTKQKPKKSYLKKCKYCSKEFTTKVKKKQYCNSKCLAQMPRDNRRKGEIINCAYCGKEKYKPQCQIKEGKLSFCSKCCANKHANLTKIKVVCQTCNNEFKVSPCMAKTRRFCSIECRNKDKDFTLNVSIKANLANLNKNGLNGLELKGNEILNDLDLKLGTDYQNQVLMFNKFCVDVLIESKKLVIQWDGVYWHTKDKRKKLDESQDAYMQTAGYKVLRITDEQIKNNLQDVIKNISRAIQ